MQHPSGAERCAGQASCPERLIRSPPPIRRVGLSCDPANADRALAKTAAEARRIETAITEYLPLVHVIVRGLARRLPANVEQDDLLSAGVFGLVDSLRRNGGDEGPAFRWYARTRILGAVVDELRAQDWLSRRTRRRASRGEAISFVALDDLPGAEENESFADSDDPAATAEARSQNRALALAIAQLPERQRRIVGRHYFEGVKFKDIGAELGVSEPRISQLHAQALGRLRVLLDRAA